MAKVPVEESNYEEFDFTPVLKNCTATYTTQRGVGIIINEKLVYIAMVIRGNMTAVSGLAEIDISSLPDKVKTAYKLGSGFGMGTARTFTNVDSLVGVYIDPVNGRIYLRNTGTSTGNWKTGAITLDIEGMWPI